MESFPCCNFLTMVEHFQDQWQIQDLVEGGARIVINKGQAVVRGTECGAGVDELPPPQVQRKWKSENA